jgi:LuxR family maltose regulon positive regulatory protein
MDVLLLNTKVHVPQQAVGQIERPRLIQVLERFLDPGHCLLVLSAPAGFGKSTLLSNWIAGSSNASFTWLTLDSEDNDPVRFWTYVLFAVRQVYPAFGEQVMQSLMARQLPPGEEGWNPRSALTLTLNDLAALPGCPVIVLDDFHQVTSPDIHRDLSYALEHWPENARLVLATRVDPPLTMARLRAAGRLVEIRVGDLRFTSEESARFLEVGLANPLEPEQIRVIEERTAGWIAGLKMVALAVRRAVDIGSIINGLSGTPRFILDYLIEEVLERQEIVMQEFLIRTAILDRFCGALCDVLTERSDGNDTLEEVIRRNLFLIPLDDANYWFRFHPLFAELLRARLQRLYPELPVDLHRRASRWFEANGHLDEAFHHAREAQDTERTTELVIQYSRRLIFSGWSATVERWLRDIPAELIRNDLRLIVSRCWTYCFMNQWHPLKEDLDRVEELLEGMPSADVSPAWDLDRQIRVNSEITVAILRAYIAYRENELAAALELARRALQLASEAPPVLQGAASAILGYVLKESGNVDRAQETFQQAGPLFLANQNLTAWAISIQQRVDVLIAQGSLREADRICNEALQELQTQEGLGLPAASYIYTAAAEVAWMHNDLEQAEFFWREAASSGELTGDSELIKRATLGRSRLLAASGRLEEAGDLVDSVQEVSQANPSIHFLAEVAAQRSAIWAGMGSLDELRRCSDEPCSYSDSVFSAELEGISRIRVMIALDRHEAALKLCSKLLESARSEGRMGRAATLLTLRALASWRREEHETALTSLRQALEIAAPEEALRIFLDEGDGLREPLAELRIRYSNKTAAPNSLTATVLEFLNRLHDAFSRIPARPRDVDSAAAAETSENAGRHPPPEPLTSREREVLELLAAGYSNQQIADRLFVSLATVKKHVGSVLEKLGAANRTQAGALARSHGLL